MQCAILCINFKASQDVCINVNMINSERRCSSFKDMNSSFSFHVCLGLYPLIQKITPLPCILWCWQAPSQHCVCTSFTFLEKSFRDKQIPSEAVVSPQRGYRLVPVEAVHLQMSAFSLVPCTAPYRTVPHVCCHPSALQLFSLDIPLERAMGLVFSEAEVEGSLCSCPAMSPGNGLSVCHSCWETFTLPGETGLCFCCGTPWLSWRGHTVAPSHTCINLHVKTETHVASMTTGFFCSLSPGWISVLYLVLAVWAGLT